MSKRIRIYLFLPITIALFQGLTLVSALAAGGPRGPSPEPPPPPGLMQAPHPAPQPIVEGPSPERLHQMIETLRMARLVEALRLDEEEAARLAVRMRRLAETRREAEHARQEMLMKLEVMIEEADRMRQAPPRDEIAPLLEKIHAEQRDVREKIEALEDRLMEGLTSEQKARMILFERHFDREVNEIIRLARIAEPLGEPPPPAIGGPPQARPSNPELPAPQPGPTGPERESRPPAPPPR